MRLLLLKSMGIQAVTLYMCCAIISSFLDLFPEIRFYVEARDGGNSAETSNQVTNTATATVTIKLSDINDSPPVFESKSYQAILTPELDALKWPLQVRALDRDAEGSPNSLVRYQIVGDSRFQIDSLSGDIRVRTPLRRSSRDPESPFLGILKVKAYDLGSPSSLSTETSVQVFSEDVLSQEIQFLFPSTPDRINRDRGSIEKMLESLTGGHVSILDVSSYNAARPRQIQATLSSLIIKSHFEAKARANPIEPESEKLSNSNGQTLVTAKGKIENTICIN
jgi:hypothetical protein